MAKWLGKLQKERHNQECTVVDLSSYTLTKDINNQVIHLQRYEEGCCLFVCSGKKILGYITFNTKLLSFFVSVSLVNLRGLRRNLKQNNLALEYLLPGHLIMSDILAWTFWLLNWWHGCSKIHVTMLLRQRCKHMIPTLVCCWWLYGKLDNSCLWYLPRIVALHSMEQSTIIAFSCKCHSVSLSYLCHVVTNRLRIFSMLTHDH